MGHPHRAALMLSAIEVNKFIVKVKLYICKYKKKITPTLLKKNIYLVIATILVALGTIGIFVPLLPTTPFLLLAAYFYMNSSKKRLKWLLNNKYLGPYIHNYISRQGMPLRVKVKTITLLWITLAATFIFATGNLHVRLFLIAVGIGVTIHLVAKKTKGESN